MASLDEEQLWQMVQDFIETEPSESPCSYCNCPASSHQISSAPFLNQPTRSSSNLQDILDDKTDYEARVLEIVNMHMMRSKMELKKSTKLRRWLVMCLQMDGFNASLCHTRWPSSPCCPSGEYEYIDIIGGEDEEYDQQRLIVDIDFRSQFEVVRPTRSYSELSSSLPQIFVGSEEKLREVIIILCSAAEESMRHRGLHIPPWRRTPYMHSKWLSDNLTKKEVVVSECIINKKNKNKNKNKDKKMREDGSTFV